MAQNPEHYHYNRRPGSMAILYMHAKNSSEWRDHISNETLYGNLIQVHRNETRGSSREQPKLPYSWNHIVYGRPHFVTKLDTFQFPSSVIQSYFIHEVLSFLPHSSWRYFSYHSRVKLELFFFFHPPSCICKPHSFKPQLLRYKSLYQITCNKCTIALVFDTTLMYQTRHVT